MLVGVFVPKGGQTQKCTLSSALLIVWSSPAKAQDLLKKVCRYRNMTWPAAGFSLAIQPLAHPEFLMNVKNWMKTVALQFKHVLAPFFLPSCTPREAAHPQVVHALHNRKEWEQSFPEYCADSVPCPCHSFRGRVPSDDFVDGHLACGLEMLSAMHPAIALLSQGSGTSAYFPGKARYFSETNNRFRLWHKRLS